MLAHTSLSARIHIESGPIDPETQLRLFRQGLDNAGAIVSFTGLVRGQSGKNRVNALTLQHYAGFTEQRIAAIYSEAQTRWPLQDCLIMHRHGEMQAGDVIVFVATAAEHRRDAFEAADFLMDYLKTDAPFWKQETQDPQTVWIEPSVQDRAAKDRWSSKD